MRTPVVLLLLSLIPFGGKALADDLADILAAAADDNAQAQMVLGGMYEIGLGVARNNAKCAYWWQRAANNGHVNATKALGSMYFSGRGVPQDYAKAMQLYLKAAERGHPHAIKYVALGYKRGMGLPQDDAKAAEWSDRAAALGGADSTVVFLESYESEETEVRTDAEIFAESLRQAEKGNSRAFFYVGAAYLSGIGTPQDYPEAVEWMRRAADENLSAGLSGLGLLLQLGQGTEVDRVEAQKLFHVMEAQRPEEDVFLSELNGRYMTEEQKGQARRQADAWLAKR